MNNFLSLYNLVKTDKRKERFDIILEPLQAITQLSLMAFCPTGSKLTLNNNLLFIQTPNWGQGIVRSFQNDKRDDLFFLFNVINRFNKFYGNFSNNSNNSSHCKNDKNDKNDKLFYDLLIRLSKRGIDKILQTYSSIDESSLLHTLQMYRTMLDNPSLINGKGEKSENDSSSSTTSSSGYDTMYSKKNIDDIFIKIKDLYSSHDKTIILNVLTLIEKRPEHYETYIFGLNQLMDPVNLQIKKWINDNIVY